MQNTIPKWLTGGLLLGLIAVLLLGSALTVYATGPFDSGPANGTAQVVGDAGYDPLSPLSVQPGPGTGDDDISENASPCSYDQDKVQSMGMGDPDC